MKALLEKQRAAFVAEGFVSAETRLDRLDRALSLIHDNQGAIADAIEQDFGNRSRHQSLMSDVYATMESLKYAKKHLHGGKSPVIIARDAPGRPVWVPITSWLPRSSSRTSFVSSASPESESHDKGGNAEDEKAQSHPVVHG